MYVLLSRWYVRGDYVYWSFPSLNCDPSHVCVEFLN